MLSLMLFAGVVCVWSLYFRLLQLNPQIARKNEAMRAFSRDLVMTDPNRISIARQLQDWYDESIWNVYVPEGKPYVPSREDLRVVLPSREDQPGLEPELDPLPDERLLPRDSE